MTIFKSKILITLFFILISCLFVYFILLADYFPLNRSSKPNEIHENLSAVKLLKGISSLELRDYQGNKITIDESILKQEQSVIIHLWASWCGPCVNEVPELIEYSNKNKNIKFIIISLDEYKDDIEKFLKSFPEFNSVRYLKIWDYSNQLSKFLDVDRLPMSIIIKIDQSEPRIIRSPVDWKNFNL